MGLEAPWWLLPSWGDRQGKGTPAAPPPSPPAAPCRAGGRGSLASSGRSPVRSHGAGRRTGRSRGRRVSAHWLSSSGCSCRLGDGNRKERVSGAPRRPPIPPRGVPERQRRWGAQGDDSHSAQTPERLLKKGSRAGACLSPFSMSLERQADGCGGGWLL